MKQLRYLVFCLAFSFHAAAGILPVFRHSPKPPIQVQEDNPFRDPREYD